MPDPQNPYAPPVETAQAPPLAPAGVIADGELTLSSHGWELVDDMNKWMRVVSSWTFVGAGLMLLAALLVAGLGVSHRAGGLAVLGGFIVVYALLMFAAALGLRRAAAHFHAGVVGDATSPLALGFRNLRMYLIIYGIFGVLGLATTVAQLLFPITDLPMFRS